jgi:hypothetical protein
MAEQEIYRSKLSTGGAVAAAFFAIARAAAGVAPALVTPPAVPEGYQGVLEGYAYRSIAGSQIEYLTAEGPKVAPTWADFLKIVGARKR